MAVTISGDGTVTGLAIGDYEGLTWTDVSGSRANGTTYTNNTGSTIFVAIQSGTTTSGSYTTVFTINGITAYNVVDNYTHQFLYIPVPDGNTYNFNCGVGFDMWMELR